MSRFFSRICGERKGFTLTEMLIVVALVLILGTIVFLNLVGRKNTTELSTTAQKVAGVLNDARTKSMIQEILPGSIYSNGGWGVHFDCSDTLTGGTTQFFTLFFAGYDYATERSSTYYLPKSVSFVTSTLSGLCKKEILFTERTGLPTNAANAKISLFLTNDKSVSSTVSVSPLGLVTSTLPL